MIFKTLQRSRSRYSVLGYNIEKTRSVNNLSNSNSNSPAGSGFLPLSHTLSFSYFALFLPKAQDCRASTFQALSDKHMLVIDLLPDSPWRAVCLRLVLLFLKLAFFSIRSNCTCCSPFTETTLVMSIDSLQQVTHWPPAP